MKIGPIEKGIAIPEARIAYKYQFTDMEVGDSFAIEPDGDFRAALHNLRTAANANGNKYGRKFVTRHRDGVVRCWRIE